MKRPASLVVIAAISAALFAAPALAADQPGGDMHGMKMSSSPKKAMGMKHRHHAAMAKMSCTDYAWQSQDQKDCEAGKMKPPHGR